MRRWRWLKHDGLTLTMFLDLVFGVCSALAQQTQPPTLEEILSQLDRNLQHYQTNVPNLFCEEHVVSKLVYGEKHQVAATDSIFRLERRPDADRAKNFVESREITAINGSPAKGSHIGGPAILTGVFSRGLDAVSLSQTACMHYALQPVKPETLSHPYVVEFSTLPKNQRPSTCLIDEGTGQVFVDRDTMQVTRMELTVPHHVINPGEVGTWHISVSYAPVLLGGNTFWMPAAITSTATPTDTYVPTVWSFDARYTNYHKLEVTSRILPFGDSIAR
jgi:hypothetical protein